MIRATLAVPGDLATPTGGYGYARRLLAEAAGAGVELAHLALPGGFPDADEATLAEAARRLHGLPAGAPILVDGLALGAIPAKLLRGLPGPLVALCHHPLALETGINAAAAERFRTSERAVLAASPGVVATSRSTARILVDDYDVPEARLTVAPPGTDPAPPAQGSGGSGVAILSVGSLTPRKGHDVLIRALAALAGQNWHLSIAGPTDLDRAHTAEITRAIADAGLTGRVTLVGALDRYALDRAYHQADLFALASRYEGFGMAYTEAMAHGLPVVGCRSGAVAEATRGAALLLEQGDEAGLSEALDRLIGDREARRDLASKCRAAAEGFTRWPETAALIAGALRRVTR